jgi:hypothetical protein
MPLAESIFLDFHLPNAATWFYLSLVLAVALFFKFSRFLSVRNWDVITMFLLVPGLLLRVEARSDSTNPETGMSGSQASTGTAEPASAAANRLLWYAYLWLLCGSAYFLVRCLLDLTLVRRPALSPNLNMSGMAWLGGALFICLVLVALRQPAQGQEGPGRRSTARELAPEAIASILPETEGGEGSEATLFWVQRALAIACHLAIVTALVLSGWRHFQDVPAGMAAAVFYLLLPYTAYHFGQWHHVWPTALLVWAVAAYRWPVVAGVLLGLAAGTVCFPVLVFPLWLSFYWRRGARRFAAGFALSAALALAVMAWALSRDGSLAHNLDVALRLSDWQPWREPSGESFWTRIAGAWAYRIPVFIAYLAFVLTTAFWPMPKNLAQVIALSAAVLIGIQFWYGDQGGVYVLWYLPLLLLLVFRPNLADRQPPPITPESDRLAQLGRFLRRRLLRLFRFSEPLAPTQAS